MRTFLFFIIFSFSVAGNLYSQDLDGYKYVQVPEKFDFLKHENQYQLNALTAFLLEKYGFEALYEEDIPANVNLCDVLQAKVHKKSTIFRSRVYVTLEDCNDQVVFTSPIGTSRKKNFKISYQEALRDAFKSFEELRKYPELIIDPVPAREISDKKAIPSEVIVDPVPFPGEDKNKGTNSEVIIDPFVTSEEIQEAANGNPALEANVFRPNDLQEFVNAAVSYYLQETPAGFDLYRKGEEGKFGTFIKSGGGENFLYSSKNLSGNAFFDTNGNLVVEYLDPNTQQLVSVFYKRIDQ